MNTRKFVGFVGMCTLWLLFPNTGHSELVQAVNFHLTAHITTGSSDNGDMHVRQMKTVRITTKDILDMLGKVTTNDFHGAKLVTVHRGESFEVWRGNTVLADVSNYFIDEGASQDTVDQNFNSTTGKDNYHGFWLSSVTFDDQNGNRLTLTGMIEERYTATTADSQGMQHVSDDETLNGTGNGTLTIANADQEQQFTLVTGTLIRSGKGVVPLNTF
jgi:hypothetical protein